MKTHAINIVEDTVVVNTIKYLFILVFLLLAGGSCSQDSAPSSTTDSEEPAPSLSEPPQPDEVNTKCPENSTCAEKCRKIFKSKKREREQCMQLSIHAINQMYSALDEVLKTPIRSRYLNDITEENFTNILRMAGFEWYDNIQKYEPEDSKIILNWLLSKTAYTNIVLNSSSTAAKRVFPKLLEILSPDRARALSVNLSSGDSFLIQAERLKNNRALMTAHDLFVDECSNSRYSRYADKAKYACVLGELYCYDRGRKFEEVYSSVINGDQWLKEFARVAEPRGLGLDDSSAQNLGHVCRKLCSRISNSPSC